jgi:hypothetical protein
MPYLKHESGGAGELRNSQILGDRSPLEFDEDGYAFVEDPAVADKLLAMHRHIERGGHGPDGGGGSEAESESGTEAPPTDNAPDREGVTYDPDQAEFDAAEFVDRTPMDDVVDDIESGDYDDHLEAIKEAADREGVQDAVSERRE